ncbi:MAG: hypothetical protein JSS51_15170 [Planctomycetes bacterium]|nr:hypothetical protein [Planctomycetota bacterium]
MRVLSCLVVLICSMVSSACLAGTGRLIAIGDEWLLSDLAFAAQPAQTTQLTDNISKFFTDGSPSRMLVWSTSPPVGGNVRGVLGEGLKNRMKALGHTWEVNPNIAFTVANLRNYRAIFLSGGWPAGTLATLESYLRDGGNVLVMAGTGDWGSAAAEANAWNPFLNKFGLAFGDTWFAVGGGLLNVPTLSSGNPLGKLLTSVQWGYGQTVEKTPANNPLVEIAVYGNFSGFSPLLGTGPVQPIIGTLNITTKCIGDLNEDGMVDDADFVIFLQAYNLLVCDDPAMPVGCPSDFNQDGMVDDADFTIFIQPYDLPICL